MPHTILPWRAGVRPRSASDDSWGPASVRNRITHLTQMGCLLHQRAYEVQGKESHGRQLDYRRNRKQPPCDLPVSLIGKWLHAYAQEAAHVEQRERPEHQFLAPKHAHTAECRQDPLADSEDHHGNKSDGESMT